MRDKVIATLVLFFISITACYAQWTNIRSYTGNPVQCNKWGWVEGNFQTVWSNSCTPLEVQSLDGTQVYSVDTTEGKCGEDELAMYYYNEGDDAITFAGCSSQKDGSLKKNIKR